jgi:hypothetical protein
MSARIDTSGDLLGVLYVARHPCGRVVAMAWEDDMQSDAARDARLANWRTRGYTVERLEQRMGDPMPQWVCMPWDECECREGSKWAS